MAEKGEGWVAREGKGKIERAGRTKERYRREQITPVRLGAKNPKERNAKHRGKKKRAPKRKEETYIIPICFTKFNCLVASLDARTVYKYIDLPTHKIQSTRKHGFDVFRVAEVAVHHFDTHVWAECRNGGNRIVSQSGCRVW